MGGAIEESAKGKRLDLRPVSADVIVMLTC